MKRILFMFVTVFVLMGCTHTIDKQSISRNNEKIINTNEANETNQTNKSNITKKTNQMEPPLQPKEEIVKNILLIGVDSRGEKRSNSDSIMIAQYNPTNHSLKIASIMRDSYVKIPNYSKKYNKINHAFLLGGSDLLKETIYNNFGLKIDSVAVIDFNGFKNVINLIAPHGIEVEITEAMIKDMKFNVPPGKHKLLAEDLLKYVRFRHDAQSDFGRVKRQQEVLLLLKDEAIKQFSKVDGIIKLPKVFSEVTNNVKTDLPVDEIVSMATMFVFNPIKDVKTLRIPVEDSFKNKTIQHAGAVLQINFQENMEALEQFFSEEEMVDKSS